MGRIPVLLTLMYVRTVTSDRLLLTYVPMFALSCDCSIHFPTLLIVSWKITRSLLDYLYRTYTSSSAPVSLSLSLLQ